MPWLARVLMIATGLVVLAAARHAWKDGPRASAEAARFGYRHRPPWGYQVGAVVMALFGLLFIGLAVGVR